MSSPSRPTPAASVGTSHRIQLSGPRILECLDRDADYPDPGAPRGRVYTNRQTGDLIEFGPGSAPPCAESWLEIPIPTHGQRHRWFRSFLDSVGREDEYTGSIGRWLRAYGSDARRRMWAGFRAGCLHDHVVATCRRSGMNGQVV